MIFIAVANVLAITRNYSPKIALRVHLLDAMKTGASSTVANGGPADEKRFFLSYLHSIIAMLLEKVDTFAWHANTKLLQNKWLEALRATDYAFNDIHRGIMISWQYESSNSYSSF